MKGRIIALGILSLVCSITGILAVINKDDNYINSGFAIYGLPVRGWTTTAAANAYLFEWVTATITGIASLVLGIVHLSMSKEPIRGMNIAIGVLGILAFTMVNWILCIIAIIQLSSHKKAEQQTTG